MASKKTATIFDHLANISHKKTKWESLSAEDQKAFSVYMVNRWLSMKMELCELVDALQPYTIGLLSQRESYRLYSDLLPKTKIFSKYIKGKKSDKYNDKLIVFLSEHFQCSRAEARDHHDFYMHDKTRKDLLKELIRQYGIDPKTIMK